MDTLLTVQLVKELNELHATNVYRNEQVKRLQDEHHYLQQLFDWNLIQMVQLGARSEIKELSAALCKVAERIFHVQQLIAAQQHLLDQILADDQHTVCLTLIEQHSAIIEEIELLMEVEHQLKEKLLWLVKERGTETLI